MGMKTDRNPPENDPGGPIPFRYEIGEDRLQVGDVRRDATLSPNRPGNSSAAGARRGAGEGQICVTLGTET